jgi:hypothetical protein
MGRLVDGGRAHEFVAEILMGYKNNPEEDFS